MTDLKAVNLPYNYVPRCRKCGETVLALMPKPDPNFTDVVFCTACGEKEPIENVVWRYR